MNSKQTTIMYSQAGAAFQEKALETLDHKGSAAHKLIGQFVTDINNGRMSYSEALTRYYLAMMRSK